MSHFARVENGLVTQVIVAEQDFVNGIAPESGVRWIQTSYNTSAGVHAHGGTPLRKNFAAEGFVYLDDLDAFAPPSPSPHWVLNTTTCQWEAPFPPPTDGAVYDWNDFAVDWQLRSYYGS
jgi:hypothetical protein